MLRDLFTGTANRLYALADYFQPTALADTTGTVQERYVYRAFGDVSYYKRLVWLPQRFRLWLGVSLRLLLLRFGDVPLSGEE